MCELKQLYKSPLPSSRNGALYNSFSYPTKISPEAVAIYIACHTKVGDTVLDPFSGSGSTGLATLLCDHPTADMKKLANTLGVNPVWGKRNAILYELSPLGAFIAEVMCNPPLISKFKQSIQKILMETEKEIGELYSIKDLDNKNGKLRYLIWSEVLICPKCNTESTYFDSAVSKSPLQLSSKFKCPCCTYRADLTETPRVYESVYDIFLKEDQIRKKRIPVWVYGRTGKKNWNRRANLEDYNTELINKHEKEFMYVPLHKLNLGMLYRSGYHSGITHLHHLYTLRNLIIFSKLWGKTTSFPSDIRNALQLLLLSYNSSHSTLMSRVVVKKNNEDFVITGAQSGVLYISNLPVEKNILDGLKRKIKTFESAFRLVEKSRSEVSIFNLSSTRLDLPTKSIDYVFTDPPFGDYIPYSEINQINEAWLGRLTDTKYEAIVNPSQGKQIFEYKELMKRVFSEVNKTLKDNGKMTLVFHSAKAEIWQALVSAFREAGFFVSDSNILDKSQGSFKQVTSTIKVQGDPILLLNKVCNQKNIHVLKLTEEDIIEDIVENSLELSIDSDERKPERVYSRYISACLVSGIIVSMDAKQFYELLNTRTQKISN